MVALHAFDRNYSSKCLAPSSPMGSTRSTASDPTIESTPLVVDGVMFTTEPPSNVVALDARSGNVIWRVQAECSHRVAGVLRSSKQGSRLNRQRTVPGQSGRVSDCHQREHRKDDLGDPGCEPVRLVTR